jgi:hypothetical protein
MTIRWRKDKGKKMQGLTEGRIVHFVLDEGGNTQYPGRHVPAMIVRVFNQDTGMSNLLVFSDVNDFMPEGRPVFWRTSIAYSDNKEPNTWHWIEQA